ncbi:flagellar basal body rod protein FlgB [Halalkalibacillus halophilus]|uniref:flagellar basal body rod protein FlgB n=1 Tax=Halalkalibacillus halophilus TaxID=392827 RepID=UPI0004156548|nr:flagellar basal body rod protein FlgB [Halalkalibacillus halophilus]
MKLFDDTIQNLQRGMDYASTKNQTIGQNIANVDTPGYKAKSVSFNDFFNEAQANIEATRTNPKHIPFSDHQSSKAISSLRDITYNNNGNSVDLDKQMNELAKNQLYYEALTERVNGKFNSIQTALGGGR